VVERAGPVDLLSHPVVVGSLLVLVVNDHVGKPRYPGPVTGIASDLAVLVLVPALVLAVVATLSPRSLTWRTAAVVAGAVALGYASMELLTAADHAYEVGLGTVGAPVRRLLGQPGAHRVVATPDRADLLALPAAAVVPWLWHRAARP
jgi:hypothetical protein